MTKGTGQREGLRVLPSIYFISLSSQRADRRKKRGWFVQTHYQTAGSKNQVQREGSFLPEVVVYSLSCVWLFATPWTVARQAPSISGISQASTLELVAVSFSRESSRPGDHWCPICCIGRWILYRWPSGKSSYLNLPVSVLSQFSCVQLFATLWTIARNAPLSLEFSSQEYWSGLPFHLPSSQPRDWTCVSYISCIGMRILYHSIDLDSNLLNEMSDPERHTPPDVTYVWNLLRKIGLIDTENRLVVARRWGLSKMDRGSQKAQTSN